MISKKKLIFKNFRFCGHMKNSWKDTDQVTGVSYKWYASVAGLPNLYSVIDE